MLLVLSMCYVTFLHYLFIQFFEIPQRFSFLFFSFLSFRFLNPYLFFCLLQSSSLPFSSPINSKCSTTCYYTILGLHLPICGFKSFLITHIKVRSYHQTHYQYFYILTILNTSPYSHQGKIGSGRCEHST